ncbi:hypothetical protein QTP86_017148 [Hemibagrus guttatus]|nr:hypothetical protein QTP86_017148 [Hemibagrus guttatus]
MLLGSSAQWWTSLGSAVDVARLFSSAVGIAQLFGSAVGVARLFGSAVGVARLFGSAVGVARLFGGHRSALRFGCGRRLGPFGLADMLLAPPTCLALLLAPPICLAMLLAPPTCLAVLLALPTCLAMLLAPRNCLAAPSWFSPDPQPFQTLGNGYGLAHQELHLWGEGLGLGGFCNFINKDIDHAPNTGQQHKTLALDGILETPITVSSAEVHMALRKTNPQNTAGPENIPGQALMVCSLELADVFTDIYNLSLTQALVPTCFKSTTIIPLPKKNTVTCLNDYHPIALTPIAMKCSERIVMCHIKRNIPTTVDPFQFAYRQNRSTEDAVNAAIHTALTHLESKDTYVRMLFIDYSLAFNTVIPHRLSEKLLTLGLTPSLCNWMLNFLMDRL